MHWRDRNAVVLAENLKLASESSVRRFWIVRTIKQCEPFLIVHSVQATLFFCNVSMFFIFPRIFNSIVVFTKSGLTPFSSLSQVNYVERLLLWFLAQGKKKSWGSSKSPRSMTTIFCLHHSLYFAIIIFPLWFTVVSWDFLESESRQYSGKCVLSTYTRAWRSLGGRTMAEPLSGTAPTPRFKKKQ